MPTNAGRTVYGNGSFAPNRGQVSAQGAQGYIKRQIAQQNKVVQQGPYSTQPVGRDGKSDRRSGVAQAALNKPKTKANTSPGKLKGRPAVGNSSSSQPKSSTPTTAGPAQYSQPVTQVVTGPTGTLSIAVDSQFAPDVQAAYQEYQDSILAQQEEDQANALEYQEQMRKSNASFTDQKRNTLNDNASRGVAFSSAYSTAVGRDQSDYDNQINYLNQWNTNNQTNSNNRRNLASQSFNGRLAAIMAQNADYQADQNAEAYAGGPGPSSPASAPSGPAPIKVAGYTKTNPFGSIYPQVAASNKPKPKPDPPKPKPKPKGKK